MNGKTLHHLCDEARKRNLPLLARRNDIIEMKWSDPPRPQASFGLINDWVEVGNEVKGVFAKLVIPFQSEKLGWVKRETLKLFRFNTKKKRFEEVDDALIHPKHSVVYASIDKAGVYGLIGLHTHPLVQETIRLLCEMKSFVRALPREQQGAFRDRVCEVILCANDMDRFFELREEIVKLAENFGIDVPENMPSPVPRLANSGETICDRCHGVDIVDLPDCHVLEPVPEGPCKQAAWENVGPKHISGAMRQIVIDPTSRRRLYAVSANGGIWKLNNVDNYPNEIWRPLTDTDDVNNLRFRTMAVAPSDGRILYAANSVKELRVGAPAPIQVYSETYRSGNRGRNWKRIHQAGMGVVHRIVVHPANPDVVFAASSTGLWRQSTTIGIWTNLRPTIPPIPPDDCLDVALDPDDSSIIYLGIRNQGVFKSFTSGADWSLNPILSLNAAAAGNGRQMIKIALGRQNADGTNQTSSARTVVVRLGDEINVSQTGGDDLNSWQRQVIFIPDGNTPPGNAALDNLQAGSIRRSDTRPRQGNEWCNCLAVDPFDARHILVGAVAIFESPDSGQTWTQTGFPHEDQHSLAFDENMQIDGKTLVYVANDGGIFSSINGGTNWPSMRLAHTIPDSGRGTNLAMGLITSEFRHSAVRSGRCVAAIDHTGYILSENFDNRWQFLFNDGTGNFGRHGGHENGFIFSCPASSDRWYMFNMRADADPTSIPENPATAAIERVDILGRLAQFDFTRTNGLVDPPVSPFAGFLSNLRAPVFEGPVNFGTFFPDDLVYNGNMSGPFAIRFSEANDERLILIATVDAGGTLFNIQSLRLDTNGTNVDSTVTETANSAVPFSAITFVPQDPDRAFAVTQDGQLFERDFSNAAGQFTLVSQWALPAGAAFVSRLVPMRTPDLKLHLLTQNAIGRYDDDDQPVTTVHTWPDTNERLMFLVKHPSRDETLFLGTSRGVYLSEDGGVYWEQYRKGMPAVPISELSFDQGYLYAATFGRGLWRCKPCPR